MLIATVLPALLWSRGEIMLHAAAAVEPDAAAGILFAGPSGSGKSTLLAQALARGGSAIADDSVRLRISHGRVLASGLSGGLYARHGPGDADRRFEPTPRDRCHVEHPVDTLVVLAPAGDEPRRLTGVAALAALLHNRHRPRIATLLGTEPDLLTDLARIASLFRVLSMRRPDNSATEAQAICECAIQGEASA